MKHVTLWAALALWLGAATAVAQTTAVSERRFVLPDHGTFVVQAPTDWKDQVRRPPNRLPPTIVFGSGSGQPFLVAMTTIWPATKDRPPQSPEQLRDLVERGARSAKTQAVESELPIVEFHGRSGSGFYFSATDRAPKPGEFKFMTQGMLLVGELSVTFTILTSEGQERVVQQALEVLKTAVQE